MTGYYYCGNLNAIGKNRVRGFNDAARVFAHRLAAKVYGRAGRCLSITRIRAGGHWVQYSAVLGRLHGPSTPTMLWVSDRAQEP